MLQRNLCSGTNLSPNASWLRIARWPSSPLALGSPKGQGCSGLPLAPWALLLGWWSPQLETNCKRLLPRGEGGFGMMKPCVHWPWQPTHSQVGRDPPRA